MFDIGSKEIVRTFRHVSLDPQDWFIERFDGAPHRVGWGLLTFQVGVDGISFSPDGKWLYYATMSHDTLYRVPTDLLLDPDVGDDALAAAIEPVGRKPQSDGIATTADGRILLTDVENGGIAEMTPDGSLRSLTASDDVVWADSVEVGPDGSIWFTDSAIPAYLQQTLVPPGRAVFESVGPFHLLSLPRPVSSAGGAGGNSRRQAGATRHRPGRPSDHSGFESSSRYITTLRITCSIASRPLRKIRPPSAAPKAWFSSSGTGSERSSSSRPASGRTVQY